MIEGTDGRSQGVDYLYSSPARYQGQQDVEDDPQLKDALRRWQREYSYFSGYSHSGFRKLMPGFIEGNMRLTTSQKEKVVETEYAQSIMVSYLATGIACAEAATKALPRAPQEVHQPRRWPILNCWSRSQNFGISSIGPPSLGWRYTRCVHVTSSRPRSVHRRLLWIASTKPLD